MQESIVAPPLEGVLRTPDQCFNDLPGFCYSPHYAMVNGLRVHYLDEGDRNGHPVLLLHGEPTWCFLYRKMVEPLLAQGHRVIAPDLVGFGRSDKPASIEAHSYALHVETIKSLLNQLALQPLTLVCQDWGSLIGLRVAAESPKHFARVVVANGALPNGDSPLGTGFQAWRASVVKMRAAGDMDVGRAVQVSLGTAGLDDRAKAAYNAPFPDPSFKAGPLALPLLVPISPDDPAAAANKAAWLALANWRKPFLTAFSDSDPITAGGERIFQRLVPGAKGQPHATIAGAGHFLQEERAAELATVVNDFIRASA